MRRKPRAFWVVWISAAKARFLKSNPCVAQSNLRKSVNVNLRELPWLAQVQICDLGVARELPGTTKSGSGSRSHNPRYIDETPSPIRALGDIFKSPVDLDART